MELRIQPRLGGLVVLTLLGCTSEQVLKPVTSTRIEASAGGIATSHDGLCTVSIPPGALSEDTDIRIQTLALRSGADQLTSTYDLGPSGTMFSEAAELAIRAPGVTAELELVNLDGAEPALVAGSAHDLTSGVVRAPLAHFSSYGARRRQPATDAGTIDAGPAPCRGMVVLFEVDFRPGRLDDNCSPLDRFVWTTDEPGKRMFIVGGVHDSSPIQDPTIDAELGGWLPNVVEMFDDGTMGDQIANDGIWSRAFEIPAGTRLGYKYTWGHAGALWTSSEEWPGNQRLLEVVDVDGDGFVRRRDEFGDESSNKDRSNLNRHGSGNVDFETDADGDGVPDARERAIDLDNDCTQDAYVSPSGLRECP